jgi:hypothetical protein
MMGAAFVVASAITSLASADCSRDTDCKGDRVCWKGVCQAPATKGCATDKDCPGSQVCDARVCKASVSEPAAATVPTTSPATVTPVAPPVAPPVAAPPPAVAPTASVAPPPVAPVPAASKASAATSDASDAPEARRAGGSDPIVRKGTLGVALGLPAGGQPTAGLTYFLSESGALRFDLGLDVPFKPDAKFNASIEVGYRSYFFSHGRLRPFFLPGAFLSVIEKKVSFALTGGIGAEYFLFPELSVSGVTGAVLRFEHSGDIIGLATGTSALFLNYYW